MKDERSMSAEQLIVRFVEVCDLNIMNEKTSIFLLLNASHRLSFSQENMRNAPTEYSFLDFLEQTESMFFHGTMNFPFYRDMLLIVANWIMDHTGNPL